MNSGKMMVGLFAIFLIMSLAACDSLTSELSPAPEEEVVPTHTEAILPTDTEASGDTPQPTTQETGEEAVSETETGEAESTPTARVGLQATDPETVMLASGETQLVEFFAFW